MIKFLSTKAPADPFFCIDTTMDEQACIRLAQEGDRAAFRVIFDGHRQRVFSLAYRYLRNQADAEDVLQDTFIKAYHALSLYRPDKGLNFSAWLTRICVNASIDALRKNRGRNLQPLEPEEVANMPAPSHSSDPEISTRNREIREHVDRALNKLPPRQRMVFTLRHYQDFSIREIAESLDSTEGSVKKHLFRAVESLKKRLRRFVTEDGYEV
jgi:RNA polymerase sigma-70 factor (ECF subfamily)